MNAERQAVYYVCSEEVLQRLSEETQALFERYPEDDGVMAFKPDERIERQARRIVELESEVKRLRMRLREYN
jgi:hypothetical protein